MIWIDAIKSFFDIDGILYVIGMNYNSIDSIIEIKESSRRDGRELYADGGLDAMENRFYSIEFRIKEEIGNIPEILALYSI